MNSAKQPSRPAIPFIEKVACTLIVLIGVLVVTGAALSGEVPSAPPVKLEKIRGWHHEDYVSIVFQFEDSIMFDKPIAEGDEVFVTLKNAATKLAPFHEYRALDSWVVLENEGNDLNVRIGLPENFLKLNYYRLEDPIRLVIRLYKGKKTSLALSEELTHGSTKAPDLPVAEAYEPPGEVTRNDPEFEIAVAAESNKTIAPLKQDGTESVGERRQIVDQLRDDGLMTLNFYQSDIQEILSALAMEREVNIATTQDVSGNVSVHLYQVNLDEALDAITLAGGFSYRKNGDLYYVYKPKVAIDPEAERLQMRIFRLQYAELDKVQEILGAIPGIRTVKIHDSSKTIIVEDTPENIKKIETILSHLDAMPKQVMIEAKILEVTLTDDMSLGVNWESIFSDVRVGTGGFSTAISPSGEPAASPVPSTGTGIFANIIAAAGTVRQFTAAIDLLQTKTKVNTLSTPKILAIHGKEARVQVGGQQGYRVTTTNVGVATETIEFIDTGTILEITPYIDDEGNILLNVQPSINAAKIEGGIPVVSSTSVSTWLMAKNGETVFIGGLIQDTKTRTREMLPCLGGLPGIGGFFGRNTRNIGKTELIVLITPRIYDLKLKQSDRQEAIEKTKKIDEDFKKEPMPGHKQFFDFLSPVR